MVLSPTYTRIRSRRRIQAALLTLGVALMAVLTFQLWRTVQLERSTRTLEIERAVAAAQRILQEATTARAVHDLIPSERRFTLNDQGVVVDATIGWLEPTADDVDLIVTDRLQRAARAEFAEQDPEAAQRAFDELLAVPLPRVQRLLVLSAAAWHSHRAGHTERFDSHRQELDQILTGLTPGDLAQPQLARAVAATLRLPRTHPPSHAATLTPFLPANSLAGIDGAAVWQTEQTKVLTRRAHLLQAHQTWLTTPDPKARFLVAGHHMLWWLPPTDENPGTFPGAWITPTQWLAAVHLAGERGQIPAWPWLVEAELTDDPSHSYAGVPFLRAVHPAEASTLGQTTWLLPAITLLLLFAFAATVWQQFRASSREAAAIAAQAEFLSTVTHELKTPLASIRLIAEMLLERRVPGRESEYHRMLVGEAARLSMLIENVLDLGRTERGQRTFAPTVLDLHEVVSETASLMSPLTSKDDAEILVATGTGTPVLARTDRSALVQALVAVLDNARKYGRGPIEVGVTAEDEATVVLTVSDHGAGVPVEERERIFDRFVRGSRDQHGSTPGVGIGLYLARTILRRMGGDIHCTTSGNGSSGACFRFTLPRENPR